MKLARLLAGLSACLLSAALSFASAAAAESCYRVVAKDGEVTFAVEQDDAPFTGSFERFGGEVCFAGGGMSRIDVWMEPASADTGLPEVNEALQGPLFFETRQHPRVTFFSSRIERREKRGAWLAHGTVTVKGREYSLDVPFTLEKEEPGHRVIGNLALDRLRYGIGTGEWSNIDWLGGKVQLKFSVLLLPKE